MKKYEKPTVSEVILDKSICYDCVTIKEHYNNSGKPLPSDFQLNIQCGAGGYTSTRNNLHALVTIKGGLAWRFNGVTIGDKDWVTCAVENWDGSGKCEAQIPEKQGSASWCWKNKGDLLQVYRNGHWEGVDIEWYYPTQKNGKVTWTKKTTW